MWARSMQKLYCSLCSFSCRRPYDGILSKLGEWERNLSQVRLKLDYSFPVGYMTEGYADMKVAP